MKIPRRATRVAVMERASTVRFEYGFKGGCRGLEEVFFSAFGLERCL